MMRTTPFRRTTLQRSQMRLTELLTFMVLALWVGFGKGVLGGGGNDFSLRHVERSHPDADGGAWRAEGFRIGQGGALGEEGREDVPVAENGPESAGF